MMAFVLHMASSTLAAYALALATGAVSTWVAVASLLIGVWFARSRGAAFAEGDDGLGFSGFSVGAGRWIETVMAVYVFYAAYRHFGWMMFYSGERLSTLHPNNFGDLPLHLGFIRYISNGAEFPLLNPIYAWEKLRYPIGVDLYSALWEKIGVPTQSHFFAVGLLATYSAYVALRAWGGWWAIAGFFFGGGYLTWSAIFAPGPAPLDGLAWKNLFLSVWITQRGMLYALPAGLWLLGTARKAFRAEASLSRGQWNTLGILWGAMALFHLHSFFSVSVILAGLAVIYRGRGTSLASMRRLLWLAVPIGAVFVVYLTDGFSKAGVAHWRPGWMVQKEGMFEFLIVNFRFWLLPLLLVPALAALASRSAGGIRGKTRAQLIEFGFYLALFALFMNLMLAPWEWDNIKVLLWPYLGLLLVLREMFADSIGGKAWSGAAETALAILLAMPGVYVVGNSSAGTSMSARVGSLLELSSTEGALARVPRSALILAAPTHDHPLAVLGYRRVLGYQGHLWSHGIESSRLSAMQDKVMRGRVGWREAARGIGATHIAWGPAERALYGDAPAAWKTALPNVSPVAGYEVYEIR